MQHLCRKLKITELDDQNREYLLICVACFNEAKKLDLTQRSYHSVKEALKDFLLTTKTSLLTPTLLEVIRDMTLKNITPQSDY